MKTCFRHGGSNPYRPQAPALVALEQSQARDRAFRVTYGWQVWEGLDYATAATKLGEALLHYLACEGHLTDKGPAT